MKFKFLLGVVPLAVSACSTEPQPLPAVDIQSATETAISSNTGYRDPFAGFQNNQVSGPMPWRALNDAQSEGN